VEGLEIGTVRAEAGNGWFYSFGSVEGGPWSPMGIVYDRSNAFTDEGSYSPRAMVVGVQTEEEEIAIEAGDYVTVTYDGGQTKKVYFPSFSGDEQWLYVGADGSTYWDAGLCELAQGPPAPTPTPTATVPPANQALETGSVSGMRVAVPRSVEENGFVYYMGTAVNPSEEIMGSVNDSGNEFMEGAVYPSEATALFVEPVDTTITVDAGDCLVIVNEAGEEMNVYLPEISSAEAVTLYIGRDGTTYWDAALTSVACAAPGGDVMINFQPESFAGPASFYRDWAATQGGHWGAVGAQDYGW